MKITNGISVLIAGLGLLSTQMHTMDNSSQRQHNDTPQEISLCISSETQELSFIHTIAEGALIAGIKSASNLKHEPSSSQEAAVGGVISGSVQGLRRAYIILNHLQ